MKEMQWWLICDEDIDKIKLLLDDAINLIDVVQDLETIKIINDALHTFDTGLHKTDCIPADFQGKQIDGNGLMGG